MLTLADVLEALTGTRPEAASLIISEAAIDSRLVIPGALFVALPGERVDGHDYVEEAFRRGAHLALVQKDLSAHLSCVDVRGGKLPESLPEAPFCLWVEDTLKAFQSIASFWRRKLNIRVVGITGSVGKSTTKELIYEVLSQRYHTLKSPGNLNNEIGLPLTLLRLSSGYERAVLEMGFYVPGEISFLCDLALPQVGVITNVGTVHAERAGSQEAIARGKAELVQALPPAPNGVAILNYDDPWVRPMAAQTQAQTLFYGLDPEADLWADEIESQGLKGILFRLHYRQETLYLRAPMIGQHSVHTVLRATAVGLAEGLSWQEIVTGLQQGHTQLRLMAVHTESGALVLDDTYNASPESTMAALNLLNELSGRRIAVLGDMLELGPYEKQGHELVGIRAAQVARLLVAVGNRGKMIAEAARLAGMSSRQIMWVETVPEAITVLQGLLKADDVVLVKGSHGLHMERIVSALEAHA
ncbi:MAG TPA: UDP-N-acetylmuramoyl-tripeptide--D-alanyl-D-alanine ligase [Anaerolineaceae bacterium]|nr:UDP-N-acetylmuramoyl-tripeptide--D-alanyl-D-alanine ligase [Anaerolineaceae bacterium]HOD04151.1 UDP-N-acetylmuramoyl-tripeptide--D-alanyl-D-alanine ligase [Anaerolineaceae bacterium]HOG78342.1 UDP-N-acetylmuramoyl-tripeptide--D-alanyl-D-alanine ligase [Anaerolineaceae bacterium]